MKKSQKKVYPVAIIAIIFIVLSLIYTTRIMNGWVLKNNVLIALNTNMGDGVNIQQESNFVSFETGFAYDLSISNIDDEKIQKISVAVPIKNLKSDTTYSSEFRFNMHTNSPESVMLKSNSSITNEQSSFETDIDFLPITINNGSKEYVVDFTFETNDQGVGYAIFDFDTKGLGDTLNVDFNSFVFTNFKEIKVNDFVDTEQESETASEII